MRYLGPSNIWFVLGRPKSDDQVQHIFHDVQVCVHTPSFANSKIFLSVSGLCSGLTALSTNLVMSRQNRRFLGIKPMEIKMSTENR